MKKKKVNYVFDITLSLSKEGRLAEERWFKKLSQNKYEEILDFIYDKLTKD